MLLRMMLGVLLGTIATAGCNVRETQSPLVSDFVEGLCGASACGSEESCVTYFPIRETIGPAVQACERTCSPANDECGSGELCAMQSDGPGFVCRPKSASAEVPEDIQRVIALAEVWSHVRLTHPWLAYPPIDWTDALVSAIPHARAARNDSELADVVGDMLARIGDPATAVRMSSDLQELDEVDDPIRREGDALVVVARGITSPWDPEETGRIAEEIAKATMVVFDVRDAPTHLLQVMFERWNPWLVRTATTLPTVRQRVIHGFPSELIPSSGGYYEALETRAATIVRPADRETWPRIAFVVGRTQGLPPVAVPLQEQGQAIVVAPEPLTSRVMEPTTSRPLPGGDHYYEVRTADIVVRGGTPELRADLVTNSEPVAAAIARLGKSSRPQPMKLAELPPPAGPPIRTPEPAELPETAVRMASAIDLWSTLDVFHAYSEMRPEWDGVLGDALVETDAATDWPEHVRALLRLSARSGDGHSGLLGEHVFEFFGRGHAPFRPAIVEGCLVVAEILEPKLASGLEVGDVIASIDDVPVPERFRELAPLVSASTPAAHRERLGGQMLRGPVDQPLRLVIDRDGGRQSIELSRLGQPARPSSDAYRRDPSGTIGIVDLRQLEVGQVATMFESLSDTRAIVFDLRGYPKGTAWSIAPYLDCGPGPTPAAAFERPILVGGEVQPDRRMRFLQYLPTAEVSHYRGRTIMLLDAGAISQAEYTGMFFRAANGTTFVGSPTAGANGDVTTHGLPDGLWMHFTGQAVAFPDNRPLQRVGLEPDLHVEPSIEGIRQGRDEILDAALEMLGSGEGVRETPGRCR
jgi:hypothetical protein